MIKRLAALAFAALLLASCVSTPAQTKAPGWTLTTPSPDASNTYFVGYSADPGGDAAKATEGATANLLSTIMNYIGVKISVDSSATARASYDSYQAEIVQTVRTQSNNRLAGFMVKDRYQIKEKGGRVTVYILASYATRTWKPRRPASRSSSRSRSTPWPCLNARDRARKPRDAISRPCRATSRRPWRLPARISTTRTSSWSATSTTPAGCSSACAS